LVKSSASNAYCLSSVTRQNNSIGDTCLPLEYSTMAEEKKEEEGAVEEVVAEAPSGGGNKIVMILTVVNIIATMGIGGVLFMSFSKEKSRASVQDISVQEEHGDKKEEGGHGEAAAEGGHGGGHGEGGKPAGPSKNAPRMVKLEQFTINLSTPGSATPKFVRASISIEVPNEDSEKEVNNKMPQVRNSIIDLFNAKRPADLATAEGRDYLKEEVINALNSFLITGKVKGVYFTSFALSG